jgi:TPR repeat protein
MIPIICLLLFPFVIWQALKTIRMAKASAGWNTTSGVVTASTTKKVAFRVQPRVTYSYEVNGSPYTGERITFVSLTPKQEVDGVLGRYPLGQAVTVYYAPADPRQSVLEPGANKQVSAPLRAYIYLFTVLIVVNVLLIGVHFILPRDGDSTPQAPTYGDAAAADPDYGDKLIMRDAQNGNAHDQCSVGKRYLTGYKIAKDPVEAAKWFQKSADQGDAEAQDWLGVLYAKGMGVTKNYDEALSLFHKSAGQGNKLACVNLGRMYDKGEGVAQDHQQAVQWYQQAKGDPDADAMMKKLGISTAQ